MKSHTRTFLIFVALALTASSAQGQWEQTTGVYGGSVDCFAFRNGTVFAGTGRGVYRSTDHGETWSIVNGGLPDEPTRVAANDSFLFATPGGFGVFRSTDNGTSWDTVNTGLAGTSVFPLFANQSTLIAYDYVAWWRSTDNGSRWVRLDTNFARTAGLFSGGGSVILETEPWVGSSRSVDGGAHWTRAACYGEQMAQMGQGLFAVSSRGPVFFSQDSGAAWTQIGIARTDSNMGGITALLVCDQMFIALGDNTALDGGNLFVSTDSCKTWAVKTAWLDISEGLPQRSAQALGTDGTYLWAAPPTGGVWRRLITEVTSVGRIAGEVPKECMLGQNYPNPFNPSTRIRYTVGGTGVEGRGTSNTKLVVYDLLGREMAVWSMSGKHRDPTKSALTGEGFPADSISTG
jgi:hypothetical protein